MRVVFCFSPDPHPSCPLCLVSSLYFFVSSSFPFCLLFLHSLIHRALSDLGGLGPWDDIPGGRWLAACKILGIPPPPAAPVPGSLKGAVTQQAVRGARRAATGQANVSAAEVCAEFPAAVMSEPSPCRLLHAPGRIPPAPGISTTQRVGACGQTCSRLQCQIRGFCAEGTAGGNAWQRPRLRAGTYLHKWWRRDAKKSPARGILGGLKGNN